jgi:hypothetical protein
MFWLSILRQTSARDRRKSPKSAAQYRQNAHGNRAVKNRYIIENALRKISDILMNLDAAIKSLIELVGQVRGQLERGVNVEDAEIVHGPMRLQTRHAISQLAGTMIRPPY